MSHWPLVARRLWTFLIVLTHIGIVQRVTHSPAEESLSFLSQTIHGGIFPSLPAALGRANFLVCFFVPLLLLQTNGHVFAQEIAILNSADIAAYNTAIDAFKHVPFPQGTNLVEHNLQGDLMEGRKLGRKIRASNAKLVLAVGLKAALAAKLEIVDIPIVYCMVLHPVKYDLLRSNMDGIDLDTSITRQLDILHHIVPQMTRVGVLFDPSRTNRIIQRASALADHYGFQLLSKPVSSEKEVPDALRSILPAVDIIWLVPDSTVLTEDSLDFILSSTLEAKVPVVGFSSGIVRSGALVGLYVKYEDIGKQAASLAISFLKGEKRANGTLHHPSHVSMALNLKVASYLQITIPESITNQADEVF